MIIIFIPGHLGLSFNELYAKYKCKTANSVVFARLTFIIQREVITYFVFSFELNFEWSNSATLNGDFSE